MEVRMSRERSIWLSKTVLAAMVAVALAVGATQASAGTGEQSSTCSTTYPNAGACVDATECQASCDAAYGPGFGGVCPNAPGCCICKDL
jgi:uncharacterized protein YgiB involved in biofilm formation